MSLKQIRALTLDLDDTLWPVEPVIRAAEHRLHSWLETYCPEVAARYGIDEFRDLRARMSMRHPDRAHDFSWLRRRTLEMALHQCGYDGEHLEPAFTTFLDARHAVELYDDVIPALGRLSRRYPLVALSNGNADVGRLGLAGHFRFALNAVAAGALKPHPAMFRLACDRLALAPERVLHVGDHPDQDIDGAARAGLRTAWVNRTRGVFTGRSRPDLEISTLLELADRLP